MALRLAWSPEAIEDIEAIAEYIERGSPWYAHAVASRIVGTAETIPEHPRMGRVVPEIEPKDIRERIVYGCRLIYRIEKKRILVAAIIHGSSARLMQAFARRAKARNKSNYAFQLTPPHCGGFLASLGAADRERYIS